MSTSWSWATGLSMSLSPRVSNEPYLSWTIACIIRANIHAHVPNQDPAPNRVASPRARLDPSPDHEITDQAGKPEREQQPEWDRQVAHQQVRLYRASFVEPDLGAERQERGRHPQPEQPALPGEHGTRAAKRA